MSAAASALDSLVDPELPAAGAGVARHARHLSLASNEYGLGWVAAGLGVLVQGIAIAVAQTDFDHGLTLYWISHGIPFLVFAALLLDASLTSLQRATIVALVGLVPTLYSRMAGIIFFSGFDEMLHARTLNDLLSGSGLFAPNSQLEISPFYPGLEMVAGTLIRLTGMPVAWAALVVVLTCRALLVLVLYQAALGLTKNARIASLVVLFYACGPQFYLFNSQFSYQTLALTLGAGGLMLLRRAQTATNPDSQRRLRNAAVLCLGAMEVSHHLTSWVMLGFLWLWTIVTRRNRRLMLRAALTATGLMIAWTAAIAVRLTGYLGPVFVAAFTEFSNVLSGGGGGRKIFADTGGDVVPTWQRGVLLAYAVICALAALIAGFLLLRNAMRRRDRAIAILGLLTLAYPATFAGRLAPSAAEVGDRASTFLFLPLALSLAGLLGVRGVATSRGGRRRRTGLVAAVMAVSGVAYIGGVALGAGPDWARLPGPYLPSSDRRSADPENLAAIKWVGEHLAPGSRIVADRFNAVALEGYTRVYPIVAQETNPDNKKEAWIPSYLYFSPTWGTEQVRTVEGLRLRYIYVDTRIGDNPPHVGFYFIPGEYATSEPLPGLSREFKDKHPIWLTKAQLTKFDTAKGLTAVYRHGPIVIYDTKGVWGRTDAKGQPIVEHFSGWTGSPHRLPPLVDLGLGMLIGGGLFAGRRAVVGFFTTVLDDAGGTGLGVTVLASTVVLGFPILGTGILPGPLVTMGALLAVAVLVFVGLARGRFEPPRLLTRWQLQPLVMVGLVLAAAGLFTAYKSLWTVQVYDPAAILASLSSGGSS